MPFLFVLSCLAVGAALPSEAQVAAGKAKKAIIVGGQGDITVRAARQTNAKIHATSGGGCEVSATVQHEVITLRLQAGPTGSTCQAGLEVTLPVQLDVEITAESGTVRVSGLRGNLSVRIKQGNAVLGGHLSGLTAELQAGSMSATGLSGNADITLNDGNAQLWYESGYGAVQLDVKRGNVTITAPIAQAAVRANLLKGTLQASIPTAASAAFSVDGTIERGNLIVRAGH